MKKMHRFLKINCIMMALVLVFALTGCGAEPSLLRYDLSGGVTSLDPQFADGESEQLVIYNMMEGLMRQLPSGELENGVITGYEVSEDQTVYTFSLKEGMVWDDSENTPVTAHDFVFAFQRIFNNIYPSPFASMYSSIHNSQKVLSGQASAEELGVKALDDMTVQFTLDYADPAFLESLAHSSAMPCSQKLFENANGKYGATIKETYSNGPFYLMQWENGNRIYLKKNDKYYGAAEVQSPGIYLYMNRDVQTTAQKEAGQEAPSYFDLLMDGKSDGCLADYEQYKKAKAKGMTCEETESTVWALVFNQTHTAFCNQQVRQGFIRAIDRSVLEEYFQKSKQENLRVYDRLIPPTISLFTQSYTEQTSVTTKNTYDPQAAYQSYRAGMDELEADTLRKIQLLVPSDSSIPEMCGLLQQAWQSTLAVSVNIEEVSRDELSSRLSIGDYQVALVPLKASANTPTDILSRFTSSSTSNISAYKNPSFDSIVEGVGNSHDPQQILNRYVSAETMLLDDAVAYPLMVETSYFVLGEGVSGIQFYPYGGKVIFRDAVSLR
mgnify:FL=1